MTGLFESAKRTLSRAQHHIDDLNTQLAAFQQRHPWFYDIERDLNSGHEIHKIKITEDSLEWAFPCIVFDAVNNLRASLDQASYAACVANGMAESTFAYFPFASDVAHWPNKIGGFKHLHGEVRTFFERLKAYEGGNNTLWAINELCNTVKHARLVPIRIGKIEMTFPAAITQLVPITVSSSAFSTQTNEIVLARLNPDPQRGTNTKITFAIVLEHPSKVINGRQPIGLLNDMVREVERILMGTEAECARLGLPRG
jgi:hypothetical protein